MKVRLIILTLAALVATAGVGPAATAAQGAGPRMTLAVYFERDGALWLTKRTVPRTVTVAHSALQQVLAGPNAAERAAGVSSAVPAGSRLHSVSIHGGNATIDMNGAFAAAGDRTSVRMRLAQLTFTALQFPTVERVVLEVNGQVVHSIAGTPVPQPATKQSFYRLVPAILVRQPVIGGRIPAKVTIAGNADVFEAVVHVRIVNAKGRAVAIVHTLATCGTGCRGTFSVTTSYHVRRAQPGTVVVFDDGGNQGHPHVVRIPVRLTAG